MAERRKNVRTLNYTPLCSKFAGLLGNWYSFVKFQFLHYHDCQLSKYHKLITCTFIKWALQPTSLLIRSLIQIRLKNSLSFSYEWPNKSLGARAKVEYRHAVRLVHFAQKSLADTLRLEKLILTKKGLFCSRYPNISPSKRACKETKALGALLGRGGYFVIRGWWGCATGWGRIFTAGLTIMGSHIFEFFGVDSSSYFVSKTYQNVCTADKK